jgi:hypothetical protein
MKRLQLSQVSPGEQVHSGISQTESTSSAVLMTKVAEISGKKSSKFLSRKSTLSTERLTSKSMEVKSAKLLQQLDRHPCADESADKSMKECVDVTASSAGESSHMRLRLEPIRAQIISYLTLLRKMTTNHP